MSTRTVAPVVTAVDPASEVAARRTLLLGLTGTMLVLFVFGSVVTTVPATVASLHAGAAGQTWALSGMSLGLAIALLTAGTLADEYGRRRVFIASSAALSLASVLAALAPTIAVFVAARILQGVAGAGVLAASLGLIAHAFPSGARRTRATGHWGAAVGAGTALGPFVSALFALAVSWRTGYWFQAVCAGIVALGALRLVDSRSELRRRADAPGTATFAAAMGLLVAGVTLGRTAWSAPAPLTLLALAVLLLAVFVAIERRQRDPMMELALLREPLFVASITGALFAGAAIVALVSTLPSVAERALAQTPVACGWLIALFAATGTIVASVAHRLPTAFDARQRLIVAFLVSALGLWWLSDLSARSGWTALVPGLLAIGVGYGLANAALGRLAVDSVAHARASMGSGANNTARYVGGAVGIAIVAALEAAGHGRRAGAAGVIAGWDRASSVAAGLSLAGAVIAALIAYSRGARSESSRLP